MVTFLEWLKSKKGIVIEAGRHVAMMTHEELPDTAPEPGQIVVFMDRPKANITNSDLYAVMNKTNDAIILVPKKFYDQAMSGGMMRMPPAEETVTIPQSQWKDFTLINHLLTRNEKMSRFGMKPVWIVGASKDRWIANREAELRRQSRAKGPGVSQPGELDPQKLSQFKQQFTQGAQEEEPAVAAARNWLRQG